ncbi:MAG TPA: hypothetical protein VEB63_00670 [Chitinophagaceae bacterium]|nr:hypothetical protein [Chitinophagaceae bacterium]
MPTLTSQQLSELGDRFLALAQGVGNFRMQQRAALSRLEHQQLRDLHWTLLNYADDLYTTSARLVMDEVEASLARVKSLTSRIQRTFKNVRRVQKLIDLAAAAITLGGAIFSKNPKAILDAIAALEKRWKAADE